MLGNLITKDNWNISYYENNDLKAFISISMDNKSNNDSERYSVNLCDHDEVSLFEMSFDSIEIACRYINNKYAQTWDFKSMLQPSGSGCSTCVAH